MKKTMRIAIIGQKGIPVKYGGVEYHVFQLALKLVEKGHNVIVYTRNNYTDKNLKEYKGIKLIHLPTISTKHLDTAFSTFLASIDVLRRNVDVIHYHSIGPCLFIWIPKLFKRKAKVISTVHCKDYEHKKWGFFARFFLKIGEYLACKIPHKTIVVSKLLKNYIRKKYKILPCYIPNGVCVEKNMPDVSLLKKWNLKPYNYILTVNRLVPHKGIHYLIKAYNKISTDKKLVIVGGSCYTDDYFNYLKKLAKGNKNIIFTGFQYGDFINALYCYCYLFVQPSESEGLSTAILNALSYNRPVLASNIPENLELIKGIGFEFENKNVNDLYSKLEFLIKNPELLKQKTKKQKAKITQLYDWNRIIEDIMRVYSL